MNIVFMGSKQAGMIGFLSLMPYWYKVEAVIAYDNIVESVASTMRIVRILDSINKLHWPSDILISIHGREVVSNEILSKFKYGGINVHPMLSKYKGINPIGSFIAESLHGVTDDIASVGCHRMTQDIDGGEILSEHFIKIDTPWEKSFPEIYNELYPLYPIVLMEALKKVCE